MKYDGIGGMAQVFVTRFERNRYIMSGYLVDYWCLGIKDTLPIRKRDRHDYDFMVNKSSQQFGQDFREISLEQTQAIVLT